MDLEAIRSFAQNQKDNWDEKYGFILNFDTTDDIITLRVEEENGQYEDLEFTVNPTAKKQTYKRIGLGGTYKDWIGGDTEGFPKWKIDNTQMQDCIDTRIQQMGLNSRLSPSRILFDRNTMDAKSVMTQKYVRTPNIGVLEHAEAQYEDNFDPNHSWITDDKMMLSFKNVNTVSITKDGVASSAEVGDIVGFGAQVWNSETGMAPVAVGQFLERLACTNGMTSRMVEDLFRFRHVYNDLMEKLDEALISIVEPTRTSEIIANAMGRPAIISTIAEFPKIVSKIPKIHHTGIIKAHTQDPIGVTDKGINGWGVYNAVTRYAQHIYPNAPDYTGAVRQDIMAAAYPLLTL